MRHTIADLAPSHDQDTDFVDFLAILRGRLDAARRDYGIATSFTIAAWAEGANVPPEAAAHLLRIVDEAITNAIRHGRAHQARVLVGCEDGSLRLSIEDDGAGFETGAVPRRRGWPLRAPASCASGQRSLAGSCKWHLRRGAERA